MQTQNTEQMITLMQAHFDADTIKGGDYDHGDGSFCNIGCLANGDDDVNYIEKHYGIPKGVIRFQENIFEALPKSEQPQFALDCAKSIGVDGKDLSLVIPHNLIKILGRLEPLDCVTTVIKLYERVIAGEDVADLQAEFRAATYATYAASAAAYASDERQLQKSDFIESLKAAPTT